MLTLTPTHLIGPEHQVDFWEQARAYEAKGLLTLAEFPDDGLTVINYTDGCVFGKHWDNFTLQCRGLIVAKDTTVARPWPKFFNVGECPELTYDRLPQEVPEWAKGGCEEFSKEALAQVSSTESVVETLAQVLGLTNNHKTDKEKAQLIQQQLYFLQPYLFMRMRGKNYRPLVFKNLLELYKGDTSLPGVKDAAQKGV